jgi:pyruvate kinase
MPRPLPATVSRSSARALLADLSRLRTAVAEEGAATLASWAPALRRPGFAPAALNLAHYLALRRRDVRDLQLRLASFGLSSLGQSESRVLPALDAILATLGVVAGQHELPTRARRAARAHRSGQTAIEREQVRLFGSDPQGPRTRIMVTMPAAAAADPDLVARMLRAGADCARINCAHDGPDVWRAIIRHVRAAARRAGRRCAILMDLAGPKVRVVSVTPGKVRLARGDRFELVSVPTRTREAKVQATVSHAEIIAALTPGATVWIDDGRFGARVVAVARGRAVVEVVHARDRGERLRAEKGINLPSVDLAIDPLTPRDLADLDFVAAHADCVGYSFVQRPSDVVRLQRALARRRPGRPLLPVVLKIETALAVRNLPRLIVAAGARQPVAVMIARGDLAVEIGLGRLSEVQEQILWICEAAHVPVVWATQVLERLVKDGAASRGEATDAAMGQRAECVMLNKGPHQVEAIAFLDDVLRRMDRHQHKKAARLAPLGSWSEPQTL